MGKTFEKQTKTTVVEEQKQVDALKSLESSDKQLPSMPSITKTLYQRKQ